MTGRRLPGRFRRHRVIIEPYIGSTGTGLAYGPPVETRCFLDEQTRLVRSPEGDEVTSSSTAYSAPGTIAPPLSRVTLPGGRTTKVIQTLPRDSRGLGAPDHTEIHLE